MNKRYRSLVTASARMVSVSVLVLVGLVGSEALGSEEEGNPAFQAFQTSKTVIIPANEKFSPGVALDPLPEDKRLVMEYVSVFTETEIPSNIGVAGVIRTTLDGDSVFHNTCVAMPLDNRNLGQVQHRVTRCAAKQSGSMPTLPRSWRGVPSQLPLQRQSA